MPSGIYKHRSKGPFDAVISEKKRFLMYGCNRSCSTQDMTSSRMHVVGDGWSGCSGCIPACALLPMLGCMCLVRVSSREFKHLRIRMPDSAAAVVRIRTLAHMRPASRAAIRQTVAIRTGNFEHSGAIAAVAVAAVLLWGRPGTATSCCRLGRCMKCCFFHRGAALVCRRRVSCFGGVLVEDTGGRLLRQLR